MAHSGKTITFATDLLPNEDGVYNLGKVDTNNSSNNRRWNIYGDVTGNVSGSAGSVPWSGLTGTAPNISTFNNDTGYLTTSDKIKIVRLNTLTGA